MTSAQEPGSSVDRAAVFDVLPTPYVVLTPDLQVVDMNAAYLAVTGRDRGELIGQDFLTAFPPPAESLGPDGRSELQVSLEQVRDTGLPDTLPVQKYPIPGPDGQMLERHWLAVHVPVLDDDGRVRFVVQRTEDITEFSLERERVTALAEHGHEDDWRTRAERTEADLFVRARELADALAAKDASARQLAMVTEATIALASASSLAEVEDIVVAGDLPFLGAAGGGIITHDGRGGWRITVSRALGADVQARFTRADYDSPLAGCWCARTGDRLLLPTRRSGLEFDAEAMSEVYAVTRRSGWAFAPLVVGERRLGSLSISWADEHELTPAELDLLDGFASQCAQALLRIESEEALQAEARDVRQLAEALQQALLTPPPPPGDRLRLVTRYRPAGHHAQIGGDWYDALRQPDGSTVLVIGDVVGHDSAAAAKMGQLRGVLRTLAFDADEHLDARSPALVVSRLERVAQGLAVDTLATLVLARVEAPADGGELTLRWTNAGHPPPVLLLADGTARVLDSKPDLLVGIDVNASRSDHEVGLPAGSTLLLFTDGLIERRDEALEVSMDGLCLALSDLAGVGLDELCDTLLARIAPAAGEDDIALLAVRAG